MKSVLRMVINVIFPVQDPDQVIVFISFVSCDTEAQADLYRTKNLSFAQAQDREILLRTPLQLH